MSEFPPLPKNSEEFTAATVNGLLGSEGLWFRRGSILYQAARRLVEDLEGLASRQSLIVGKPVATVIDHERVARTSYEIVPAMLYGMAMECWMKGFLVAALPRTSRQLRSAINRRLDEILPEDLDGEAHIRAIFDALATPELKAMLEAQSATESTEDEARTKEVKNHKKHDLVRLAKECGLDRILQPHDREYLGFLSKAIVLGRYPSAHKAEDLFPWEGIASDLGRWESLNDAVYRFHDGMTKLILQEED